MYCQWTSHWIESSWHPETQFIIPYNVTRNVTKLESHSRVPPFVGSKINHTQKHHNPSHKKVHVGGFRKTYPQQRSRKLLFCCGPLSTGTHSSSAAETVIVCSDTSTNQFIKGLQIKDSFASSMNTVNSYSIPQLLVEVAVVYLLEKKEERERHCKSRMNRIES